MERWFSQISQRKRISGNLRKKSAKSARKKVRKKFVCEEMVVLADVRRLKERSLSQNKKNQRKSAREKIPYKYFNGFLREFCM